MSRRPLIDAAVGAAFAVAILHGKARRRRVAVSHEQELTEREKWNAEVERKNAEKKARKAKP